jgi:hypothetical protein
VSLRLAAIVLSAQNSVAIEASHLNELVPQRGRDEGGVMAPCCQSRHAE